MNINSKRGFTLIELLVVIAIIGILSSVVLASLNTARSRGADANIKANLSTIGVQAELYYDSHSSTYAATAITSCTDTTNANLFDDDATIKNAVSELSSRSGSVKCGASKTAYAIQAQLVSDTGKYFCVDSQGSRKEGTTAMTAGDTTCPAT